MSLRSQNEAQEVIDKLAKRDSELRHENEEISAYVQVAKVLATHTRFFVGAIVISTLWLGKMQWTQAINTDAIKEIKAFCAAAERTQTNNQLFDQAISNTVSNNRTERMNDIKNLNENVNRQQRLWDTWTERFSEIWFSGKKGFPKNESHPQEGTTLPE